MKNKYYLGMDAGGTKTTVCICDEKENILYNSVGESLNYRAVGLSEARKELEKIMFAVADKTGITHFAGVCIGMSALSGRATQKETDDLCKGILSADAILMDSDLFIALQTVPAPAGVAICGTGSMAVGRGTDGEIITKGGFGHLLGDEGSAYCIAADGIKTAIRAAEHTISSTALTEKLFEYWKINDIQQIIPLIYDTPPEKSRFAGFAKCVTEAAREGDETALSIIRTQATAFAGTCCALLRELPERTPLYLYGGVFGHDEVFLSAFRAALPGMSIEFLPAAPVMGALKSAKETYCVTES